MPMLEEGQASGVELLKAIYFSTASSQSSEYSRSNDAQRLQKSTRDYIRIQVYNAANLKLLNY